MAIAVYGRLDELLRERGLTADDLKLQIEVLFGLPVDAETLRRLTGPQAAYQTDLNVAAAVTRVLGVGLDDLFASEATPFDVSPASDESFLTEEETRRVHALQDRHNNGELSRDELRELETLVYENGRRSLEQSQRRAAEKRGVPLAQIQREAEERLTEAAALLKRQDADPQYRRKLIEHAKQRRASAPR